MRFAIGLVILPIVYAWNPFYSSRTHDSIDEIEGLSRHVSEALAKAINDSFKTARHTCEKSRPVLQDVITAGHNFVTDKTSLFNIETREKEYFIHVDVP